MKKIDIKSKLKIDNIAVAVVLFIVCVTLICVMFMQFRTIEETDITEIENMRETELRTVLAEWKSKYEEIETKLDETNRKIKEYNEKIDKNEEASELIDKELEQSNLIIGNTNVQGEGIVITLKDKEDEDVLASTLTDLVNELRYAGAEAISINDVRVISTTDIVDLNQYTSISVGGQRLSSPYVIKAIGNQTYLSSILNLKDSGFIDRYRKSGYEVEIENSKKIEILKYNGELTYKYLEEIKGE